MYIYIYVYVCICIQSCDTMSKPNVSTYLRIHTYIHACILVPGGPWTVNQCVIHDITYIHTCICVHTYIYTHIHTYINIYTYIQACILVQGGPWTINQCTIRAMGCICVCISDLDIPQDTDSDSDNENFDLSKEILTPGEQAQNIDLFNQQGKSYRPNMYGSTDFDEMYKMNLEKEHNGILAVGNGHSSDSENRQNNVNIKDHGTTNRDGDPGTGGQNMDGGFDGKEEGTVYGRIPTLVLHECVVGGAKAGLSEGVCVCVYVLLNTEFDTA
jgi:hypothetical protein